MASPFSIFRKHRKAMLAALTILTMFGFVFLPIMLETMGSREVTNPLVVKTSKFGKIYADQLGRMVQQRHRVINVLLNALISTGVDPNQAMSYLNGTLVGEATEESVVDGWLQARRAEQLGLLVSNEAIKAFLRELTRNSLKPERLREILRGQQFSEYQFFHLFRDELMAMRLRGMFEASLHGATPAQRWDYYTRLKRKATVEVAPVAVEGFVSQVPDPDEATLSKFFEEHKDKTELPDSPEPGFHEPHKVNLRYFKAELEKFMAEVSDEDIKQEYEKNKDSYDQREAAESKAAAAEEKPSGEKPPAEQPEKPSAETPAPENPTPEKPAAEQPATEKPSSEPSPGEKPPAPEAAKPAPEIPPTEKKPDPGKNEESSKSADPGDASGATTNLRSVPGLSSSADGTVGNRSPFRLATFLQDQTTEQKPEQSQENASADEPKAPAAEPKQPATEPNSPPADSQGQLDGPALPAAGEKPGEKPSGTETPPSTESTRKAGEDAQQPKDRPSARIKEEIRAKLASEKITKSFTRLQDMMLQYGNKWRIEQAKGRNVASLPALDFAALAAENRFSWGETGPISALQARGLDIGMSFDGRQTFIDKAYATTLLPYRPDTSFDLKGNRFLFWKVAETKQRIPRLDEPGVRQRVVHAWKMIEARGLAKKEAQRLSDEARKATGSLAEIFRDQPDIRVTLTAPFSWLTFGNLGMLGYQSRPELSKVAGVDLPGTEFMRAVFDLTPGGIGEAMNAPQTAAYVVRTVEVAPSDEVLWKQFEADPYDKYAAVAYEDQQAIIRAWLEELKSSAGLKWERKPDRSREQAETPEE